MKTNIINFKKSNLYFSLLLCLVLSTTNLVANTNCWLEVEKLFASNAGEQDWFGWSVAIAGNTAVVGAYKEDSSGVNSGAAYVFEQDKVGINAWNQVKKITPLSIKAADFFGSSIAIEGNLAVVGAIGVDVSTNNSTGAVYVFERNTGGANNWGEVKVLTASDAQAYDSFGQSVSIFGNLIIIGTANEKAYIFERNQAGTNEWDQVKILSASDAEAGDWFGHSVGISTNVAIVGAKNESTAGENAGTAYLFERNTGGANAWGEIKKLSAINTKYFGVDVAIAGDSIIVGADGVSGGSAFIFDRNTGGNNNWGEVKKLIPSDLGTFDQFGHSVDLKGNVAIVGAPFKDYGTETFAGAAYIFERNNGGANAWGEVKKMLASSPGNSDLFGNSVSLSGGLAVIGAYNDRERADQAGAAYIFESADPASELFENAPVLPADTEVASGNNFDAMTEPGEKQHADNGGPYHSVWWDWSSPTNDLLYKTVEVDLLSINTAGSDFDTVLAVYTGLDVSNLTQIVANDNAGIGLETSEVSFQFNPGEIYHIVVDGKTDSDTGNIVLNYEAIPEPGFYFLFFIFNLCFVIRRFSK